MRILISNGLVYYRDTFQELSIYIDENKRMVIADQIDIEADEFIDASGLHIVPGLIDPHVHLREPGFEYKETIESGTMAAIKGGYTTLFCMPNLSPVTDDVDKYLALKKLIAKNGQTNVYPYVAITKNEKGQELVDFDELSKHTLFFSDDGKGVQDEGLMLQAMHKAYEHNGMIVAHCEDERELEQGACVHDGFLTKKYGLIGINSKSEFIQIKRDIDLVRKSHCQYHVCHISTKEGVELIRQAKKEGLNISAEVTPHHLLLCEHDVICDDGNYKMNPPLRTKEDQKALIEGLQDGVIEIIATDHAPHSLEEKSKGLKDSLMGIVGLETSFGLLYKNLVKKDVITLEQLVRCMSSNVADIFGIDGGVIEQNEVANLAIFNLSDTEKITEKGLVSKSKNTPFINEYLQGVNYMTIVNGIIKYRKKGF